MKNYIFYSLTFLTVWLFSNCSTDSKPKVLEKRPSIKKLSEITVYVDSSFQEAKYLDTLSYTFQQPFILAPSTEPLYDLNVIDASRSTVASLDYDKVLITGIAELEGGIIPFLSRNLHIENIKYNNKGWYLGEISDHWVAPQTVYVAIAKDKDAFAKYSSYYYKRMIPSFKKDDAKIITAEINETDKKLESIIARNYGVEMTIPSRYQIAAQNKKGLWLRKDDKEKIYGLLVYKKDTLFPLNRINATQFRNEAFGSILTQGQEKDSVVVEDIQLPVYASPKTIDSLSGMELRGVWRKTNSFMGGSFISYIVADTFKKQTIITDGFYFAPRHKKRDGIRRLEGLLKTAEF